MRRAVAVWMALALTGCSAGTASRSATAPAGTLVRVVSYNVHAGKDAGGQPNLELVAVLLDSIAADIALLQEMDRRTARSGRIDQIAELERLTGMAAAFGKSLDYQGGEYGIAILSRWPITSATVVPLAVEPPQERAGRAYEPRVVLHAVIETPGGPLHVLNTHLDPGRPGTYRRQELIGVLARAARDVPPDAPLVIGGDLNARPDTDEIGALGLALRDVWAECGRGAGETFPAAAPDRRIDYLFIRTGDCRSAEVIASVASDHRPLWLVLELR